MFKLNIFQFFTFLLPGHLKYSGQCSSVVNVGCPSTVYLSCQNARCETSMSLYSWGGCKALWKESDSGRWVSDQWQWSWTFLSVKPNFSCITLAFNQLLLFEQATGDRQTDMLNLLTISNLDEVELSEERGKKRRKRWKFECTHT